MDVHSRSESVCLFNLSDSLCSQMVIGTFTGMFSVVQHSSQPATLHCSVFCCLSFVLQVMRRGRQGGERVGGEGQGEMRRWCTGTMLDVSMQW